MRVDSPFLFGKSVSASAFVNREEEIRRLSANLSGGINTMLISPRRWGKSSLVKETARRLSTTDKNIRFCFLDFFTIRSEEEFYQKLSAEVLKVSSNKVEEWAKAGKEFFKSIVPKFSMGIDPEHDLSVSFNWSQAQKHRDEILELPEKIAKSKGIRIIICIDEFQNLTNFRDPDHLEKLWRSIWQHQESVTYCLYGSKRHMMTEIFNEKNRPFYRFGDMMVLGKIQINHWVEYITSCFENTGKSITPGLAAKISTLMKLHSYYVQQLAHLTWVRTAEVCTDEIVDKALDDLLQFNSLFYQQEIENLSNTQVSFLEALVMGVEKFTSVDAMNQYGLGTPRNVAKNRIMLERNDIIDISNGKIELLDPAFELWFRKNFLQIT